MNKMNWEISEYARLVSQVYAHGEDRPSRAGPTRSMFGMFMSVDLDEGFPLLKGRKMYYKGILGELAAFVRNPKNVKDFEKFGCNYWKEWADPDTGALRLDYGTTWTNFYGTNQLKELVETLKTDPYNRRMIISSWRPNNLKYLSLPCCHLLYQFYVREGGYLDMVWYQRSVDLMVGLPSDIVLAAAMLIALAAETNHKPGKIKFMLGDTHIYTNHFEGVKQYLSRMDVIKFAGPIGYSTLNNISLTEFLPEFISVLDYEPLDPIKFELNV